MQAANTITVEDLQEVAPESKYQHTPLPNERSFRLLRILEGNEPEVRLSLTTFSLDIPPKYHALSYTWGRATCAEDSDGTEQFDDPLYTAYCDGSVVSITENLMDGFLEFRRVGFVNFLWVDAICINQLDMPERQSQVSQMGDIYANAHQVLVWLGKDENDLDNFARIHEVYYPQMVAEYDKGVRAERIPDIWTLGLSRRFDLSEKEWHQVWRSYVRFYRTRRWFRRGWVLQEIALAKSLAFCCARKILDFDAMDDLMFIMKVKSQWLEQLDITQTNIDRSADVSTLSYYRERTIELIDSSDITKLIVPIWVKIMYDGLEELRHKEVTVPHDKIYAVLGICNRHLPSGVSPITVDYSLSVADLFSSVSEMLIGRIPNLNFLESVNNKPPRDIGGLPSWSSNFGPAHPSIKLKRDPLEAKIYYQFSGEMHASLLRPQIHGRFLTLNGNCVDICTSISAEFLFPGSSHLLKDLLTFCQRLSLLYAQTGENQLEALWRTIIGNRTLLISADEYQYPAQPEYVEFFTSWVSTMLGAEIQDNRNLISSGEGEKQWTNLIHNFEHSNIKIPSFQDGVQIYKEEKAGIISSVRNQGEEFHSLVRDICLGRRLFLTANGYLGAGPDFMEIGDQVWLLETGDLGYILRPVVGESTYTFVGAAYLHGFMDGQALDLPGFRENIKPVQIA